MQTQRVLIYGTQCYVFIILLNVLLDITYEIGIIKDDAIQCGEQLREGRITLFNILVLIVLCVTWVVLRMFLCILLLKTYGIN